MRPVACYNCDRSVLLDGAATQRCPDCHVVLVPVPSWAKAGGWPEQPLPANVRKRLHFRAVVPVKQIRFAGSENVTLARTLEAIVHLERVRMNDLILALLHIGLEHRDQGGHP